MKNLGDNMKIIINTREADDYGEGESLEIITPKYKVYYGDAEPEDASLARDYNDVYYIEDMIQEAYVAGKAGEELNIVYGDME